MSHTIDHLARLLADRYQIERELGRGGMAVVYLAHDIRHDRKVAVKVLYDELAAALGVERFLAEIRVTANLQHPHILPLLDSGLLGEAAATGAIPFYVMPYVAGDSLRRRLERERQLPIADALTIAKGVAAALAYAHRQGVIHRDIKPENILLQDGQPIVTDFGIALAVTAAAGERFTQTGLSLGTPRYMSPEQAMGERTLDARTDIYALGVVTYEMLAGETPFTGPNAPAVIARVLTEKPPSLTALRDTVPPHVESAVQQALQKLPADRFGSAAEFASALTTPGLAVPPLVAQSASRLRRRMWAREVAPWLLAAVAIGVAAWALRPRAPNVEREQWDLVFPDSAPMLGDDMRQAYTPPAISPDGTLLVYTAARAGSSMLYLTRLGVGDTRPLAETRGGYAPFFAPDGRRVGFLSENQLRQVDLATGKVSVVHEGIDAFMGTWTASERIAFLGAGGYSWIDADGAGPVRRISLQPRIDLVRPWPGITAIPGTDQVLVSDFDLRVAVVTLSDGSVRYLTSGAASASPPPVEQALVGVWARFVAPGYIVLWRPGAKLLAVRFDPQSLHVFGKPVELMRGVRVNVASVSPAGTWAYPPRLAAGGSTLAQFGETGISRTFPLPPRRYQGLSLSPDDRHIAMRIMLESGRDVVEAYDLSRGAVRTGRIDATIMWAPQWDQSGRYLYAASAAGTVHRRDTHTSAQDSTVIPLKPDEIFQLDGVVGADTLVATLGPVGQRDIFAVRYREPDRRLPLVQRDGDQFQIAMSPSGRWMAYTVVEHGAAELIVESRVPGGQRLRIGAAGNYIWDATDQLYYLASGFVQRIRVTAGPDGPTATAPHRVVSAVSLGGDEGQAFVPLANGRSLIALVTASPPVATHLVIVRHWERELSRLVK